MFPKVVLAVKRGSFVRILSESFVVYRETESKHGGNYE